MFKTLDKALGKAAEALESEEAKKQGHHTEGYKEGHYPEGHREGLHPSKGYKEGVHPSGYKEGIVGEGYERRTTGDIPSKGTHGPEYTFSETERRGPIHSKHETSTVEPVTRERVEKPAIVEKTIRPEEREVIQPVVEREREQLHVEQKLQPLKEKEIYETKAKHVTLPTERVEYREDRSKFDREYEEEATRYKPTKGTLPTMHETVLKEPIVNERVKPKIVEEVQPVLKKEVLKPTVIEETLPIREKVVEAPIAEREILPEKDLGTHHHHKEHKEHKLPKEHKLHKEHKEHKLPKEHKHHERIGEEEGVYEITGGIAKHGLHEKEHKKSPKKGLVVEHEEKLKIPEEERSSLGSESLESAH